MKRTIRIYYLLIASLLSFYGSAQAQLTQKSYTTSNGGGPSAVTGISQFGVAGQSVIGATTGGSYQMKIGFLGTVSSDFPVAPGDFAVHSVGVSSLLISWIDNDATNTGYVLERSVTGDFLDAAVFNLGADATSYLDEGLAVDTYYYYRIKTDRNLKSSGQLIDATATFSAEADENWKWASQIDVSSYGRGIAYDAAGNLFVGGRLETAATIGGNSWVVAGNGDGFLIKYDQAGSVAWARQFAASGGASVEKLKIDPNGVVYISGYFSGQLTLPTGGSIGSSGQNDAFIAKVSNAGQLLWLRNFGGTQGDVASAHVIDGSGNIHVLYNSGSTNGSFGANPLSAGLHLLSIKPDGSFLRTKSISLSPGVTGNELARDAAGNFYIAGAFSGSPEIGAASFTSAGGQDAYYAKFDAAGAPVWVKQASSVENDNAYTIGVKDSKVYVGGFFDGGLLQSEETLVSVTNTGERDGFLLSADAATGTAEWLRGIGGSGNDGVLSLAFTQADVFVSGFYGGQEALFSSSATVLSNGFAFLARYDAAGTLLAANRIEGKANPLTTARGMAVYKNHVTLTGRKSGQARFGSLPVLSSSGLSMFVASYKYEDICNTPISFAVSNVTEITAELNWSADGGSEFPPAYTIRYKPFGTLEWLTPIETSITSHTLVDLLAGVKYLVQVRTNCTANVTTTSSTFTTVKEFTTIGTPACVVPEISGTTATSDTEQLIEWNNTGAASYDLRYRLKGSLTWTPIAGILTNSQSVTALNPGMTYQVQVRGVCTDIQTIYSTLYEFTTTGAVSCAVPSAIAVSNVETGSAAISWTHAGAASYEVRYKVNGTAIWTTASTTEPTITLTDLDAGMSYVYIVRATCSAGLNSEFSTAYTFETAGAPSCEIPTGFASEVAESMASVSWTSATGAVYYDVRYRVQGTTVWSSQTAYSNTASLEGLSAGTTYQLQARSACTIDGTYVSLFSATYTFQTTGSSVCTSPAGLLATATTTTASLEWAVQGGVSSYQVRYRPVGTTLWSAVTTTSNSLEISSLVSGLPYMWTVRAICNTEGTLASPYATVEYFETEGVIACPTPVELNITDVTDVTATAIWGDTGAAAYQLRYRLGGTIYWTVVETATNSYGFTGLEVGMPYQYQVKSKCEADGSVMSVFSDLYSFATSGTPSCEIPVGLGTTNLSSTTAALSWTEVVDAYQYEVRYRIKGTALWTVSTASQNTLALSELEPGMTYQFSVRSMCSESPAVSSVFSVPVEFTTEGLPSCEIPAGFAVAAGDSDAEISWTNPGSLGYEIRYRVSGATLWTISSTANSSINLAGLETGTDYQFQVRSVCSEDGSIKSLFSDLQFFETTGSVSCETPAGLSVLAILDQSATIAWFAAEGVQQYDVRYRVKGTTIWQQVLTASASVDLAGLSAGMPYQLRIRTLCSQDNSLVSPYSQILEFSTNGDPACAVPQNLQGVGEETTASLSWDTANGAEGYEVLYRKQGDIIWTAVSAFQQQVDLSGLTVVTTYQWKVRTNCSSDNSLKSVYSEVASFMTQAAPGARTQEDAGDDSEVSELSDLFSDMDVVVYPNPSSDRVFLRLTSPVQERYTISVFSINGQLVSKLFDGIIGEDESTEIMWDGTRSPAGIYVLKLSSAGASVSKKIILNK